MRWVKATPARDKKMAGPLTPIWINIDLALSVQPITHPDSTAKSTVFMPGGDQWFEEEAEHFIARLDLAYFRLIDALAQIKALRQFGDHGAIDIAEKALERWRTDL